MRATGIRFVAGLALLAAVLVLHGELASAAPLAPVKISGDLAVSPYSRSASLSPDGKMAVFMAAAASSPEQLYVAPLDGSAPPLKISRFFNSSYISYFITADSRRVVYFNGTHVLSSPLDTGVDVQLDSVTSGPSSTIYCVAADQSFIVYRNGLQGTFYRVPIAGGTPTPVGPTLPNGRTYGYPFGVLADNDTLVFLADLDTVGVLDFYRASLTGNTAPVRLNATSALPGGYQTFFMVPGSDRFVLDTNLSSSGDRDWYALSASGGTPELIYHDEVPGTEIRPIARQYSPDGQTMIFGVACPTSLPVTGECSQANSSSSLQAVLAWPVSGGPVRRLTPPELNNLQWTFTVAGNPPRLIVTTYTSLLYGTTDLYSIGLDASDVASVTASIPGQRMISTVLALPSPDRLAFFTTSGDSLSGQNSQTVYTSTLAGGALTALTDPSFGLGSIGSFSLQPDGASLLFVRSDNLPGSPSASFLYQLSLHGGANGPLLSSPYDATPAGRLQPGISGSQILYTAGSSLYVYGEPVMRYVLALPAVLNTGR